MAEREIRIGVQVRPQHTTYRQMRAAWAEVEALGADTVFTWDHFFPLWGEPDGLHYEGWSLLAAMAEVTERAQIGLLVTCNSYRNPNLLADMARTVDHISGGRLIFGIGGGWFERDYDEYGYEFGTAGGRLRALGEHLPKIKERWSKLNPPPAHDIPVLIGGGGEKITLRIVAEHGDIWHTFWNAGNPGLYEHKTRVLEDWCDKVGRDPSQIKRSVGVSADLIDRADDIASAGVDEVTFRFSGPDYDLSPVKPWLDWRDERS